MSQLSGAFTVETGRLVEEIAVRVVELLRAGSETYGRPADPDPVADRGRHGARFGGVTDDGIEHDDPAAGR